MVYKIIEVSGNLKKNCSLNKNILEYGLRTNTNSVGSGGK